MTLLYCVRHGESEVNLLHEFSNRGLKHGLTDLGRTQVHRLADKLQGIPFHAAFSSPLLRARQSAEILSERLRIPFEITPALTEYDVGILEGKTDDASWLRYADLHTAWVGDRAFDARHDGGESYNDVCARFSPLLERIRAEMPANPVLLLGHGGTFYCVLSRLCSNVELSYPFQRGIRHTHVVIVDLQAESVTCLRWGDEERSHFAMGGPPGLDASQ